MTVRKCGPMTPQSWRRCSQSATNSSSTDIAALRQQGLVVNHKKVRRLMREHGLQPKIRRRFVATTDSDHDGPIFPNLAKDIAPTGPNQLWVSDITYVALPTRFIYVAIILDAWSRLIVGYAIGRSIDARLTVAALGAAINRRRPPPGCIHHSDRGSQGGFKRSSQHRLSVLMAATRQVPLPAFSSPSSFSVEH